MWKLRVKTCIEKAVDELLEEAAKNSNPDATIRTELDAMMRQTQLMGLAKRLKELLGEIQAVPEPKKK